MNIDDIEVKQALYCEETGNLTVIHEDFKVVTVPDYRPKGSMCIVCKEPCKSLKDVPEFATMKAIGKDDDGTVVVKCEMFTKE